MDKILSSYYIKKVLQYVPSERKILSLSLLSHNIYEAVISIINDPNTPIIRNKKQLKEACINQRYIIIAKTIYSKSNKDSSRWLRMPKCYGLSGACISGDMFLVNLMIKHGAKNWDRGLTGAARGNNPDLVKIMLAKGATNWNQALSTANHYKSIDVKYLLMSYGNNRMYY